MISTQEAQAYIDSTVHTFGKEFVSLEQAYGRILAESLYSDRPLPPYDRVTMDGIAINFQAFAGGQRTFAIVGTAAAGAAQLSLQAPSTCLEVMTGSVLPEGTDTVIRYEDLKIEEDRATIQLEVLQQGKNVHKIGEDRQKGDLLVPVGKKIGAAELGVLATIGKSEILVQRHPQIMIISTGDELVPVKETPLPHQVRRSNVHSAASALLSLGLKADTLHLDDQYDLILKEMRQVVVDYDLIILSGGVSKGKFDFFPKVLEELKVKKLFHRVAQRPGKPFWFGRQKEEDTVVFALPGNPVSSFVGTHRYILPWLEACMQQQGRAPEYAKLTADFHFKPALTYFLQVRLTMNQAAEIMATPVTGNGSGDLANLADADALLELPADRTVFRAGEVFPLIRFR